MLFRLPKILLVVALSLSLGLHWALLQSVAWVGMVLSFSQSAPLTEAVAKTFDGKHPCGLCKIVQRGQHSEQKKSARQPVIKFDLVFDQNELAVFPPQFEPPAPASPGFHLTPGRTPPTPPPKQA